MEADECGRIEHIFKFGADIDQGEISQSNLRGSTPRTNLKRLNRTTLCLFENVGYESFEGVIMKCISLRHSM
jgi:hypothetical protein